MLKQYPLPWNSAYQPCLFEVDTYRLVGNAAQPINVGGKLVLNAFIDLFPAPYGTKFAVIKSGAYQGLHRIVSMTTNQIVTDTEFTVNELLVNVTGAFPFNLKILYGYPAQTKSLVLKTNYDLDGNNITDISPALQAMFNIVPPVLGFDENYYTHFRVMIEPGAQLKAYLTATGTTIIELFGYNYLQHVWSVINGCLPNITLNELVANGGIISETNTEFNSCGQVWFTHIVGDRLFHNVFDVNGMPLPPNLGGIGFMQIENDFIVS